MKIEKRISTSTQSHSIHSHSHNLMNDPYTSGSQFSLSFKQGKNFTLDLSPQMSLNVKNRKQNLDLEKIDESNSYSRTLLPND